MQESSPTALASSAVVTHAGDDPSRRPAVKPGVRRFYDVMARHGAAAPFLNYGFAAEGDLPEASDEPLARHARALYARVVRGLPLEDARVLEAGCGRGGGALLVCEQARPSRYLGLDLSSRQVALARRRLGGRATFAVGDAEHPPVADASFDIALSVEAIHHFEQPALFFAAIHRLLVPGGRFALAGIFAGGHTTRQDLADAGFALDDEEDLTPGVLRSLAATSHRRRELVDALPLPARFGPFLRSWAGVAGSPVFANLERGALRYERFTARRP